MTNLSVWQSGGPAVETVTLSSHGALFLSPPLCSSLSSQAPGRGAGYTHTVWRAQGHWGKERERNSEKEYLENQLLESFLHNLAPGRLDCWANIQNSATKKGADSELLKSHSFGVQSAAERESYTIKCLAHAEKQLKAKAQKGKCWRECWTDVDTNTKQYVEMQLCYWSFLMQWALCGCTDWYNAKSSKYRLRILTKTKDISYCKKGEYYKKGTFIVSCHVSNKRAT